MTVEIMHYYSKWRKKQQLEVLMIVLASVRWPVVMKEICKEKKKRD